jgi:hypothetical protein
MIKLNTCKIEHQSLKRCLFEIIITLYKVKKNKPWISFPNQSNIEKEWNKKIKKIKG